MTYNRYHQLCFLAGRMNCIYGCTDDSWRLYAAAEKMEMDARRVLEAQGAAAEPLVATALFWWRWHKDVLES